MIPTKAVAMLHSKHDWRCTICGEYAAAGCSLVRAEGVETLMAYVMVQVRKAKRDKAMGRIEFWCGLRDRIRALSPSPGSKEAPND